MPTIASLHPRPTDATLTVTKAAHVLGVHPNTIRAWSDAGRLRYYRINPRGDRRYRLGDLQRFLSNAAEGPSPDPPRRGVKGLHRRGRPESSNGAMTVADARHRRPGPSVPVRVATASPGSHRAGLEVLAALGGIMSSVIGSAVDPEILLGSATRTIREGTGLSLVSIWRLDSGRLTPVGISGPPDVRLVELPRGGGVLGAALDAPGGVVDAEPLPATSATGMRGREIAASIPGADGPWGVLLAVGKSVV